MKKLFLTLCALMMATSSLWAHDFVVDGIYYNITDKTNKTVCVVYQGNYYYSYNEYTGSVTIPSSVTYNDITYSVTSIGYAAFRACSGLTSVTIPNSVTLIYDEAFSYCTGLTSVTIPNSVISIGNYAFRGCTGLTSVTLSNRIETIPEYAFQNCTSLTSIVIPDRVTVIDYFAFSGCSSLTSVTIGKRVKGINYHGSYNSGYLGYFPFGYCPSLKEFIVHEENEYFSSVDGLLCDKAGQVLICYPGGKSSNYTLPNTITSISGEAFLGCTKEFSLTIPNSVTSIGKAAFKDCTGLTSVSIPNSVIEIDDYAFWGCTGLTSITIPNSVTSIYDFAFCGCTDLTLVTIPNSVTSIGSRAFYGCTGLTSITIPNSVTSIGSRAFYGCTGLKSVFSQRTTPPSAKEDSFSSETLNQATLYIPQGSFDAYDNATPWWKFSSIVEIDEDNDTHTLTLRVSDESAGAVKGGGKYIDHEVVTIEAIPNRGYQFVAWSDGNTENPRTVTLTEDMALTAQFRVLTYQLTVQSNDDFLGKVTGNSGSYKEGEEIILTAIPQGGVTFVQWSDGNTENPRTVILSENLNLTAQFAQPDYQVNAFANDATLGEVSKAVLLEAIPASNAYFNQWSDGSTENPRIIYPTEDITLTAEFNEGSGIENVNDMGINLYATDGALHIDNAEAGVEVAIYDLSGRIVKSCKTEAGNTRIALDNGVYVVRVAGNTVKVVL